MQPLPAVQLRSGHRGQAAAVGQQEVLAHGATVQAVVDGHLHKGWTHLHTMCRSRSVGWPAQLMTCTQGLTHGLSLPTTAQFYVRQLVGVSRGSRAALQQRRSARNAVTLLLCSTALHALAGAGASHDIAMETHCLPTIPIWFWIFRVPSDEDVDWPRRSTGPHQHVAISVDEHSLSSTLIPQEELGLPSHGVLVIDHAPGVRYLLRTAHAQPEAAQFRQAHLAHPVCYMHPSRRQATEGLTRTGASMADAVAALDVVKTRCGATASSSSSSSSGGQDILYHSI